VRELDRIVEAGCVVVDAQAAIRGSTTDTTTTFGNRNIIDNVGLPIAKHRDRERLPTSRQ
jgi:hypothetical protein